MIYPADLKVGDRIVCVGLEPGHPRFGAFGWVVKGFGFHKYWDQDRSCKRRSWGYSVELADSSNGKLYFARRWQLKKIPPDNLNQVVSWKDCAWKPQHSTEDNA